MMRLFVAVDLNGIKKNWQLPGGSSLEPELTLLHAKTWHFTLKVIGEGMPESVAVEAKASSRRPCQNRKPGSKALRHNFTAQKHFIRLHERENRESSRTLFLALQAYTRTLNLLTWREFTWVSQNLHMNSFSSRL